MYDMPSLSQASDILFSDHKYFLNSKNQPEYFSFLQKQNKTYFKSYVEIFETEERKGNSFIHPDRTSIYTTEILIRDKPISTSLH